MVLWLSILAAVQWRAPVHDQAVRCFLDVGAEASQLARDRCDAIALVATCDLDAGITVSPLASAASAANVGTWSGIAARSTSTPVSSPRRSTLVPP